MIKTRFWRQRKNHALECRIYAERPEKNFLPSPGKLPCLCFPVHRDDLRIDCGLREGDEVTPFYDPMIAKVIIRVPTREAAINKMRDALAQTRIQGVYTNLEFLLEVLSDPEFEQARMTTRYVENKQALAKKATQATAAIPT